MKIDDFVVEMETNETETEENGKAKAEIRRLSKQLQKLCEAANYPMLFVTFTKPEGYQIKCLLPGEFKNNGGVSKRMDRFPAMLCAARGFDRKDYQVTKIDIEET